jgi:LysM repeat protein
MNLSKLFLVFLFLVSVVSFAQQKKYITYIVKDGETIKSIAKDFDLSTRDLLKLNPDVSRKPDAETVIIVPNKNFGNNVIENDAVINKDSNLYEVQPKDTVYGLSKKFNVSINDLIKANPGLEDGLKIGMKLNIPENGQKVTLVENEYILHTVVKDNTIYNLTRKYDVTEAELLQLNPDLKDGLKLGMVLKIEKNKSEEVVVKVPLFNDYNSNLIKESHGVTFKEHINSGKVLKVIFLLPYQINKVNDSISGSIFSRNNITNVAADFHIGALMAIDSLKEKGVPLKVQFFDSENSLSKLQSLVNKVNFNEADIVIGPLFFDKAEWLTKHIKTPVITPFFSKSQDSYGAENLIKSSPKEALVEDKLITYLERTYNGENIIVINDGKTESQSVLWRVVNKLNSFEGIKNVSVIKPEKGYVGGGRISEKLKEGVKNWVFLISEDNVTTASTINNLKGLADKFVIHLISLDKGKNFEGVDNNYLGQLNFTYPTAEFFNMDSVLIKNFFTKFQKENNTIPSDYAIRGFDVTYDVLIRLASYDSLEDGLKAGKSVRVSSSFNYAKKASGSFENNGIYIIQYTKELVPLILQ